MRVRHRLRYRVAGALAAFGGAVSLIQAVAVYVASHNLEERLIDETLTAEMQDYVERRARNPRSVPETTATIRAYVMPAHGAAPIPRQVRTLAPGRHQVTIDGTSFRAAVADHGGERFAILYNESQLRQRERDLVAWLAAGVIIITSLAGLAGFWLAGRIIAPVTDLVGRVANLRPEDKPPPLASHYRWEEIRELAHDFDEYLLRLEAFIERERAFTADVSHELRTPLAVVNGASEVLLADSELPARSRKQVSRVERAASEMSEIITALLVLAREDEGGQGPSKTCQVEAVLRDVTDKLQGLLKAKPISLALDVRAHPRLTVDRAVLATVIGNLLRNAVTYTDHGEIGVVLGATYLTVRDTGIGIEPADLPNVFDRYYRSERSRGAGIGLSLVRRICDRYGWRVQIQSQPGQGTTVRLEFGSRNTA